MEIFDIGTDITVNNADFEENPEVASYEYKLPNGWDGSGGGTVVVKSPPSAPNGPWGAGSASAQGAPSGDYFMSIQGVGNYLEQQISGLSAGTQYSKMAILSRFVVLSVSLTHHYCSCQILLRAPS